jgi:uncharacterized membrane protein YdjX (TVP38/TMEM64 family)
MSMPPGRRRIRTLIFVAIAGLLVGALQPYDIDELLGLGQQLAERPLYLVLIAFAMMLLFTFGLPGSLGLWLIAPFHPPVTATALLLAGSVGGALGAYLFSARFREPPSPDGFASRVLGHLSSHGGMLSQIALRILPGFPHSVVNFSAGILGLPLWRFLAAAAIGLAVKYGVYTTALYEVVEVVEEDRAAGWRTGAPLLVLASLILTGVWARRRVGVSSE